MTKNEVSKITTVLIANYPVYYKNYMPINVDAMKETWLNIFSDVPYSQVSNALYSYIASNTSGFPPTPGNINEMISSVSEMANLNDQIDENEAWTLVYKAIQNSVYNSKEEFAKLPPLVQQAINNPDNLKIMAMTDHFNVGVESSNFKRVFNTVKNRERERAKMPKKVLLSVGNNEDFKPQLQQHEEVKQIESSDTYEPITDQEQIKDYMSQLASKLGGELND